MNERMNEQDPSIQNPSCTVYVDETHLLINGECIHGTEVILN